MSRIRSLGHNLRFLFSRKITDQFDDIELRLNERADKYERAVDARIEERLTNSERSIDARFDERTRGIDSQFVKLERHTDERFDAVEQRLDSRMEAHERRTDKYLLQSRVEIVDRTDVMLQIFEQRLDEQRREIRALRETLANRHDAAKSDDKSKGSSHAAVMANVPPPTAEQFPAEQILSFRKMAESAGWPAKPRLQSTDSSLYQRILDWKKVARDGLNNFSADEQEIADYILSFIGDAAEREYVRQHMRRFVGTIERIPPAQSSTDRLLELGSLLHMTPAIKKFCGYHEICCADFWESDKKMVYETVMQKDG